MDEKTIDGVMLAKMIHGSVANLRANRNVVNSLNVFPVPDGDTGDNMCMTLEAGASRIPTEMDDIEGVASEAAKGMLLGARGNSGVILSRIFAGISNGLQGHMTAGLNEIADAMAQGVNEAYAAVSNPVEGTMLTVYRDAVDYARSRIDSNTTIEGFAADVIGELKNSLERTPSLLDVLREAGVVDSGGAGLVYIAEGAIAGMNGEVDEIGDKQATVSPASKIDISFFTEDSVLTFGYCTEFLLRLTRAKTDIEAFDLEELREYLNSMGDSLVLFREGTIIKTHVHTKNPGAVLEHCQQYGEFLTIKVENMTLQHSGNDHTAGFIKDENGSVGRESTKNKTFTDGYVPGSLKPRKKYGIVTVSSGKGIKKTFLDLGADICIEGGQCMNPSVEDFIRAFESIDSENIIVFPNNSNIILTAKQACSIFDGSNVRIVPTKTIGEGYSAISMLNTELDDPDELVREATEGLEGVVTGHVSKAVRNTVKDGINVIKDDYIGFCDDVIYNCVNNAQDCLCGLAEKLGAKDYGVILLISGCDVTEEKADEARKRISDSCPRSEVILIDGGQAVYDYIMVLE
ncbi:MAG: DAK2 domain-containing protein [Lachnospiraceae bacterium]|nr:DAK2 domain-containing protein [Lachnospiraceae bacterium]